MSFSKIIYSIFAAFAAFAAVALVIPALPIAGNYKIMAVLSGSMEPAVKTGGIVVVKPQADYAAGDVISFATAAGNVSTTHRIVEAVERNGKTFYITKGDANNANDSNPVDKRNVIGKMLFTLPWAGYLVAFLRQPLGFAAAVGIPSVFIIIDEGQNIWREIRRKRVPGEKVAVRVKPTPEPAPAPEQTKK